MTLVEQLRIRRAYLQRTQEYLSEITGINRPRVAAVLSPNSKIDARVSTIDALAAGLDAEWVLVPRHLIPEVNRLLQGKPIGPDNIPSAMERLLG